MQTFYVIRVRFSLSRTKTHDNWTRTKFTKSNYLEFNIRSFNFYKFEVWSRYSKVWSCSVQIINVHSADCFLFFEADCTFFWLIKVFYVLNYFEWKTTIDLNWNLKAYLISVLHLSFVWAHRHINVQIHYP